MWYYVKWGYRLTLLAIVAAFLHYVLPQRDIARIVETEVRRVDFGGVNTMFWSSPDGGGGASVESRDIRFIDAVYENGNVMVYRNEDTGWIWPPYYKFDSADLQAEAADLVSTSAEPQWVVIRHYGWRSNWFSIYPNAVSVRPVSDPNIRLIPWFNIVLILAIIAVFRAIQVRVNRWLTRVFG